MHTKKEKRNICADFTVRRAVVPLVTGRLLWVMCSCSNLKWSGLTLQFMQGVSPRPGNELGNDCSTEADVIAVQVVEMQDVSDPPCRFQ